MFSRTARKVPAQPFLTRGVTALGMRTHTACCRHSCRTRRWVEAIRIANGHKNVFSPPHLFFFFDAVKLAVKWKYSIKSMFPRPMQPLSIAKKWLIGLAGMFLTRLICTVQPGKYKLAIPYTLGVSRASYAPHQVSKKTNWCHVRARKRDTFSMSTSFFHAALLTCVDTHGSLYGRQTNIPLCMQINTR